MTTSADSYRESLLKIRSLTRGWGCYYPEIRILVHPFSTRLTYVFSELGISPNATTYIGTIFSAMCIWLFFKDQYIAALLFYVVRLIFDYADGSIARYTQTFSKFGAKLDLIFDYIFYVPFWGVICFKLDNVTQSTFLIVAAVAYVLVVDYFVEPRLKKLSTRAPLKKYFMDRGIILGFSPFGLLELWSIVFLLLEIPLEYYSLLTMLVVIDLTYRVYEIVRFSEK